MITRDRISANYLGIWSYLAKNVVVRIIAVIRSIIKVQVKEIKYYKGPKFFKGEILYESGDSGLKYQTIIKVHRKKSNYYKSP